MPTETEKLTLSDNIFTIRFKILYEFYKNAFIRENDSINTINNLAKELKLDRRFLFSNIKYLETFGYLNSDDTDTLFEITYRGTKLVELITYGRIDYNDNNMIDDSNFIVRKFQEGINKEND